MVAVAAFVFETVVGAERAFATPGFIFYKQEWRRKDAGAFWDDLHPGGGVGERGRQDDLI